MRPLGLELLGVRSDAEGPCPAALRAALLARRQAGLPAPKLFYAVPVSCNPTGVSWSEARQAAVYALACEFDFLILEDDAYFYLQFPRPGAPPPGVAGLGRSLLARDVQGRVVRADTFSKFVAPVRFYVLFAPPIPIFIC
jgi:DNA-binding transcriptional MocR family regulator